jgi:hypothetical protein
MRMMRWAVLLSTAKLGIDFIAGAEIRVGIRLQRMQHESP